ncbi:MAG: nicotinamide riboside transporter PnuC [Gammaproteobacteria bacterium]
MTTPVEATAIVLAILYVGLAIRENRWCWPAAVGSSLLYLGVFAAAGLYMQAVLQLFYAAMGFYGWWAWRPTVGEHGDTAGPLLIHRWPLRRHALAWCGIATLATVNGWLLTRYSDAAFPYLDSAVMWAAVLTTWMVTRKLLENWLYWLVIDTVSGGLALAQGLYATVGLFAVYLALSVIGYRTWRRREATA